MVRGITLDAFGTLIDTGRDVLLKVSRAALEDHGRGVAPEAFLEVWDRHFFGANPPEFLNLAEITEDSLARTFRDFGIEGDPAPYVDMLDAEWRRAEPHPGGAGGPAARGRRGRGPARDADDLAEPVGRGPRAGGSGPRRGDPDPRPARGPPEAPLGERKGLVQAAALGRTTGPPAFPLSLLGPPKIVK